MNQEHVEKRKAFYDKIPNYWADDEGEYSLYDIKVLSEKEIERKRLFAYRVGKIFFKTADLLAQEEITDETLLEIGFPKETLKFIRLKTMKNKTIIGRFDSVEVNDDEKLMEFNSDTPTVIKELFLINSLICKELGYSNPNEKEEERLKAVLRDSIIGEALKITNNKPNVVFTSHGDSVEDKNTVLYLKELADLPSKFVALEDLRIRKGEGLYDDQGRKIDVLYRQTFPVETLIEDEDPDTGDKVGEMLLELVTENKLRVINPPSAFLMQNKALMAIIWSLHEENNEYFSEEEHRWIEHYFLPTYLDNQKFRESGEKYVKKPIFGREGDTVEIYGGDGNKIAEDENKTYSNFLSVYQKYVDLPTTKIKTIKGEKEVHYMTGTFLLNGKPSSIGFRVGKQITDNLSYFLPCGF